jgi:hypothetical protein
MESSETINVSFSSLRTGVERPKPKAADLEFSGQFLDLGDWQVIVSVAPSIYAKCGGRGLRHGRPLVSGTAVLPREGARW